MRVIEIKQTTGIDGWVLGERPAPRPADRQVLVKINAVSLNYRDLLVAKGTYSRSLKLPLIPCSDGAGEVVEVGRGVSRIKVGDRVAAIFMQTWLAGEPTEEKAKSALGGAVDGVLAERVVFDEDGLVRVPDHLSYEEAATLPCAAVTAWHALMVEDTVKAGDTVLVLGSGGVSVFALQFARIAGARVIATSSHDEKLKKLEHLGASDGINYRTTPDWGQRVRELAGGVGVDHVVEVGGAGTLVQSLRAVRTGGTISLIGVLAGATEFNPLPILMKTVRLQGIFGGSREMFEAMNRAIALHQVRPVVDRVFPIEKAREALRHIESGTHFGKIVIQVS
jgi:NADPH:quinone reductase-like Zn-dependent oxidoreductase